MSRENILIKTSWISTIGNAILSASKIIIGLWAGSLAVVGTVSTRQPTSLSLSL